MEAVILVISAACGGTRKNPTSRHDDQERRAVYVIQRKDDPAFIYFPTNYRWSMGLLLCLSGAPWGGAEIDEVNRVGRALATKIGDDEAWFEEWTRMG
jgi:hypothetical protein